MAKIKKHKKYIYILTNWTIEKIENIAKEIRYIELYNAKLINKNLKVIEAKWGFFTTLH